MNEEVLPPKYFGTVEGDVYRSEYPKKEHMAFLSSLQLRTVVLLSIEALPVSVEKALLKLSSNSSIFQNQQGIAQESKTTTGDDGVGKEAAKSSRRTRASEPASSKGKKHSKSSGARSNEAGTKVPSAEEVANASSRNLVIIQPTSSLWASRQEVTQQMIHSALFYVMNTDYHPLLITCPSGIFQTSILVGCLRRLQRWSLVSAIAEATLFLPSEGLEREIKREVVEQIESFSSSDCVLDPEGLRNILPRPGGMVTDSSSAHDDSMSTSSQHSRTVTPSGGLNSSMNSYPVPTSSSVHLSPQGKTTPGSRSAVGELRKTKSTPQFGPSKVTPPGPSGSFVFPSSMPPVAALPPSISSDTTKASSTLGVGSFAVSEGGAAGHPHNLHLQESLPSWYHNHLASDSKDMSVLRKIYKEYLQSQSLTVDRSDDQNLGSEVPIAVLKSFVRQINRGLVLNHVGEGKEDRKAENEQEEKVQDADGVVGTVRQKVEITSSKELRLRFMVNPPAHSTGVKYAKKEELVDEDDD